MDALVLKESWQERLMPDGAALQLSHSHLATPAAAQARVLREAIEANFFWACGADSRPWTAEAQKKFPA